MARLAGVDIPREKRLEIALTYIYGVGKTRAEKTIVDTGISPNTRVKDLSDVELVQLRDYIEGNFKVEGDPIAEQINALLPQTQCGQCGYPGCKPYAEAIAGGDKINKCPPGGEATIQALADLLDRAADAFSTRAARADAEAAADDGENEDAPAKESAPAENSPAAPARACPAGNCAAGYGYRYFF